MADVKVAVGVGRGHDDRIAIRSVSLVGIDEDFLGLKGASLLPQSINIWLELSRFVTLGKTHSIIIS